MPSKIWPYIFLMIGCLTLALPFILDWLIGYNLLTFSPGKIDAWIGFWGSYIGAIIGASVVYFVAKIQIEKQDEQQMIELTIKGEHELRLDMRTFQTTLHVDKIEEFIALADTAAITILSLTKEMMDQAHDLNDNPTQIETAKIHFKINELTNQYNGKLTETINRIDHIIIYLPDFHIFSDSIKDAIDQAMTETQQMPDVYHKYSGEKIRETGKITGVYENSYNTIQQQVQSLRSSLGNINDFISHNIVVNKKEGTPL